MKFTPHGDRLLIKPDAAESSTKFGLIIPKAAQERVYRGKVIAGPVGVHINCTVIYSKYGGTELKLDGEDYIVVSERDVLGVLDDV